MKNTVVIFFLCCLIVLVIPLIGLGILPALPIAGLYALGVIIMIVREIGEKSPRSNMKG